MAGARQEPIELGSSDEEASPPAKRAAGVRSSERLSARAAESTAERFKARCNGGVGCVTLCLGSALGGRAPTERLERVCGQIPRFRAHSAVMQMNMLYHRVLFLTASPLPSPGTCS